MHIGFSSLAVAACIAAAAASANAQVHRCTDANGKVAFSDTPCSTTAARAERVLGSDATERRWENEAYGRERNMRSIQDASRTLREPTSDAQPGAAAIIGRDGPRPRPAAAGPAPHPDDTTCDTYSPRKGCLGGARSANPNWSPRKGYHGGGGPADQRREEEERRLAEERAARAGTQTLTNCNNSGCWGSNGVRYNRVGGGGLAGTDGSFCTPSGGNTFNCN